MWHQHADLLENQLTT